MSVLAKSHNGFPPEKRLLSTVDFQNVFNGADHRFREGVIGVTAKTVEQTQSRIGIVVPKKLLKLAVHRNRFKRVVRDEFRRWSGTQHLDLVVALRVKLTPEILYSEELANTIRGAFTRLDRYCARKKQAVINVNTP